MGIIKAPFTPEQVDALNDWQTSGAFHPFTCGTPMKHHHPDNNSVLIATENGWICTSCDYIQDWAHDFMAQPLPNPFVDSLKMTAEQSREYLKAHGYDPDEVAKRGVTFVRMASLVAKIKNVVFGLQGHKTGHEILE